MRKNNKIKCVWEMEEFTKKVLKFFYMENKKSLLEHMNALLESVYRKSLDMFPQHWVLTFYVEIRCRVLDGGDALGQQLYKQDYYFHYS